MKQNIFAALERAFITIKEESITDVVEIEQIVYAEIEEEFEYDLDEGYE